MKNGTLIIATVMALVIAAAIPVSARVDSVYGDSDTGPVRGLGPGSSGVPLSGGMKANIESPGIINLDDNKVKAVNIKDLGAKGDGVSDDTRVIQKALKGGGKVFFPAGTYKVTNRIVLYSNTQLFGTGVNSIIKPVLAPQTGASLFLGYGGASNISISNLALDGSSSPADAESYHGIYIQNNSNINISNCYIHDFHGDGIYADGTNKNLTIQDNNIRGNYRNGIAIVQGANFIITGNFVETGYVAAIDLEPYQTSASVTGGQISQNVITGINPGIALSGALGTVKNITVQKNIIKLDGTNSNARAILSYAATDCAIKNNTIDNAALGMWGTTILNSTIQGNKFSNIINSAIQIAASNSVVSDNCIYGSAWGGVILAGDFAGEGNTVENNYIEGVKSKAIVVSKNTETNIRNNFIIDSGSDGYALIDLNNSANCRILKNVIIDIKSANIPSTAISLNNCSNCLVEQNYWQGTQYSYLSDTSGKNNVFKDNKYQPNK